MCHVGTTELSGCEFARLAPRKWLRDNVRMAIMLCRPPFPLTPVPRRCRQVINAFGSLAVTTHNKLVQRNGSRPQFSAWLSSIFWDDRTVESDTMDRYVRAAVRGVAKRFFAPVPPEARTADVWDLDIIVTPVNDHGVSFPPLAEVWCCCLTRVVVCRATGTYWLLTYKT